MTTCMHKARRWSQSLVVTMVVMMAPELKAHADSPTQKDAVQPSEQVVRETVGAVFAILRDPELKKDARTRMLKLREAVDRAFDWEAMAQSSLGPPWRKLDDQQRKEFVGIFKELLAQEYMDDIDRFQGSEEVQIGASEKRGELQSVKTLLITSSREQVPMVYTLQNLGKRWTVVDLSVEGVSLVNHYRQTFSRFLANKSFSELMQQLKRKSGAHE